MFCFNELMPLCVKLDTWDQPDEELRGLAMYDATCRSELQQWKPQCSANGNTFQNCRYAVAREWIVNANVLTLLIVTNLR